MSADSGAVGRTNEETGVAGSPSQNVVTGSTALTAAELVSLDIRSDTITMLQGYGLSLETIRDLYLKAKKQDDRELNAGPYSGYRLFVTCLPSSSIPDVSEVKSNITEHGRYDNFLRYPNIGFSFMVRYNGEDYLFNQTYRVLAMGTVRMCYLVKMTNSEKSGGGFEVRRTLVKDPELQKQVMAYALSSGVLGRAWAAVEDKNKIIPYAADAQTYADMTIAGGALYGFSGTLSGSMGKYEVIDGLTPEGFAVRLTCYEHSTGYSFIAAIAKDKIDYQDYLKTNNKAYGVR